MKTFNVLKAGGGTAGNTRALNNGGEGVAQVTFTDATTGIVRSALP